MLNDDPIRGIVLSVSATLLFAAADTIAKYLSNSLPIVEFIWIRYLLFVVMALLLSARTPLRTLWPKAPKLQFARGICVVTSSVLFVYGVHSMTMAQATTISFLSPYWSRSCPSHCWARRSESAAGPRSAPGLPAC